MENNHKLESVIDCAHIQLKFMLKKAKEGTLLTDGSQNLLIDQLESLVNDLNKLRNKK